MNQERIFQILESPHVSEKAAVVADLHNQYVFKVKVDNVRTLRVKGKVKRNKHGLSARSTWKKAYVRLQQGQDIDFAAVD